VSRIVRIHLLVAFVVVAICFLLGCFGGARATTGKWYFDVFAYIVIGIVSSLVMEPFVLLYVRIRPKKMGVGKVSDTNVEKVRED